MDDSARLDHRKSLEKLRAEWETCTACELGQRREAVGGNFVFGVGAKRSIMYIGEGPGREEEANGTPFSGKSGRILRAVLAKLRLPYYLSNIVACRSCGQSYDSEGNPRYRKDYKTGAMAPAIQDAPPTPAQMAACMPRLYEEIYLVDPVLIVALGAEAAKALSHGALSINAEAGKPREIVIPGAGFHPVLTEKKRLWARKVRGQIVMPSAQNQVRYLMVPMVHPAYIARRHKDERHGNPVQLFLEGMKKIARIYERYMQEVHGQRYVAGQLEESDVLDAIGETE